MTVYHYTVIIPLLGVPVATYLPVIGLFNLHPIDTHPITSLQSMLIYKPGESLHSLSKAFPSAGRLQGTLIMSQYHFISTSVS